MLVFNLVLGAFVALGLPSIGIGGMDINNIEATLGMIIGTIVASLTAATVISLLMPQAYNLASIIAFTTLYTVISVPTLLVLSSVLTSMKILPFYFVFLGLYLILYILALIQLGSGGQDVHA
jgi:hypothetical protein